MYAIIGAGPMGLSMARNLQKQGLPFVGFEIHNDVGGLWDADSPTSTMYESAHLISSKTTTEFAEFPMRDEVAQYPHHTELKAYFQDYAREFDLYPHFEFETEVLRCERQADGLWAVTTRSKGQEQTRTFTGLMLCNGTLHEPHQPELPGTFTGEVMHSSGYKSADQLKGKRVLIIGCGNSGADIAVDAVHHAKSVDMSMRRGYHFLPKFVLGRPIDTLGGATPLPRPLKQRVDGAIIKALVGKPSDYGLPDPDYKLYEAHPVLNSLLLHYAGHGDVRIRKDLSSVSGQAVTFADGETAEYDLIIQATGYKLHYPFIDQDELNWQGPSPQLYMNCFHPEYDNLFMMGMVEAAGLGWEARNRQAELVALYIKQLANGAASAKQLQQTKREQAGNRLDGGYAYLKLDRMAYYVSKQAYNKVLTKHIKALRADMPAEHKQAA